MARWKALLRLSPCWCRNLIDITMHFYRFLSTPQFFAFPKRLLVCHWRVGLPRRCMSIVRGNGALGQADEQNIQAPPHERAPGKRKRTRDALVGASLQLIAEKGIEATSVLEITERLGISNGTFYYHFQNKEQLLEEVGRTIVENLVERIEADHRADPAAQVARGPLIILSFADQHPELRAIMLRVIEDPDGRHADFKSGLRKDVAKGKSIGRFPIEDTEVGVQFCRAIVGAAIRLKHEGQGSENLAAQSAVHTLAMLGIPLWEAHGIVEQEQLLIAGQE